MLESSTIAFNTNTDATGAANLRVQSVAAMVSSTIVSNPSSSGPNCTATAPINSQGFNLESSDSCGFGLATDQTSVSPVLGPLQDAGGPTRTLPLRANSPAVDKGLAAPGTASDQRGRTARSI